MCLFVLAAFAWLAWSFDPRLLALLHATPRLAGKLAIAPFVVCLNFFWLIAAYHAALALFTIISSIRRPRSLLWSGDGPSVAILYTTMNDFQERATESCVNQDYSHCHVYILDDSLVPDARAQVDDFARRHAGRVTVVRRPDRRGYKAGSLNHALSTVAIEAPYFAVADADSVLPPDFIRRLLPYFKDDTRVGWVQSSHRPHPEQRTTFARDLGLGIIPLWTMFYGPKNRFGFVMFLGHGGIISREVWQKVGGFPEVVSEDLCLSTRGARLGYRGVYAADVICYEDFPNGYRQLRRQQEKYVKGACQFFHREWTPFLKSRRIGWHQKLDVFLSCVSLFSPVVNLVFLATYCVFVPLFLGEWKVLTVQAAGWGFTANVLTPGDALLTLWTRDFYWATLACTLAPAIGSLSVAFGQPRRGTKMFLLSAVPYLSLMVVATGAAIAYLVSRRAVFLVTGDTSGAAKGQWPRDFLPRSSVRERIGAEDPGTQIVETAIGILLVVMCVATANVALLGLALGMGLGPLLLRTRWDAPALRPLLYLPFLLVCVGLALAGPAALAGQGAWMNALFHF